VAIVFVQVVRAIEVCVFMLFDLFVFVSSLVSLMSAAWFVSANYWLNR